MLAYLAVPVSSLPSLYGICLSELMGRNTVFDVFFGETEIYSIEQMSIVINSQQKVIRLYIPMDNLPFVNKLYSFNHLVADHEGTFQAHYFIIFDKNVLDTCA